MDSTKPIMFSGSLLVVDDKKLDINAFKEKIPEDSYTVNENKKIHTYSITYFKHYLKITFGDGSAMPRNPTVVDISTNESLPNPRQANQVEPRETFGIIDFRTNLLWVSNYRKKNSLLDFFKQKFKNEKIISKDVYSQEKFISLIRKLDDIKLSATPNLFSQSNTLTSYLADEINGYEATTAVLSFKYQDKLVGSNLIDKIKTLFKNKHNFNGLVISGRDEKNIGMIFNPEGFFRKIEFRARIDENEMFVTDSLFEQVIEKIEDENV
ncbi:hypothetical protein ACWKW6_26505 [Dyadobacter jiangsuensis]